MPSSLVKFSNRTTSAGRNLWWNRAEIDGLPFRGPFAPIMPEEEYEARVVRVADARNAFFDVTDAQENKLYLDVLECVFNGWFQMIHLERFWRQTTLHYVEWVEYYLEDGTRTPYSGQIMELTHGQQNGFGHPHAGALGP
jgi:hypothetical protein